ncbi:16S rRNA (cytidine(1402)-2'-O)-methyltransferase [Paracidobacterium acidisoli]|uniref:Ribosomal RNA small subunit methyltransferase I n=1 Tax=Paracidobacterium acidisoli TaxID=2303751 RepID=A0A372ILX5_9BACT|nr:16S rRNA (cytidine(1402)-2'-O)-methyltransferase [Paracidobacterium acidisoli]MBT9332552.1 16S rRNA (cytidine(1402)-2'-O)-methyltransferase [Paracidobacterium acidisoli]
MSSDETLPPLAPGLYLVATPIGNLEDITLRALRVLRSADRIACEDTRQTQKLLNHYGITTPTLSSHEHNESARMPKLLAMLHEGKRIAVVSDAGTPGISDPGMILAAAAVAAGIPVYPVPGASAVISALVASGLNTESFFFAGFLPSKAGERRAILKKTVTAFVEPMTVIFYETPHRILETLADVESIQGPNCHVVLARELTKLHEEFLRGTVQEVRKALSERDRVRGEMVLLLDAQLQAEIPPSVTTSLKERISELEKSESLSEMDALKRIARERGISKSEVYRELQRERSGK